MRLKGKKIFCVLMMGTLLISTGICFAEDQVVERPVYTKGDFWVFVDRNLSKKSKHTFLREENNKYIFRLGKSDRTAHYYFTSDVKRGIGYPGPIIEFPLKVGKKWEHRYQRKVSSPGPAAGEVLAQHTVVAYEPVTVPAGTFQAMKISVTHEASNTTGLVTIPEKTSFWYAPEVKQLVKKIFMGKTWELKKFRVK